jgi:hypothetical protein
MTEQELLIACYRSGQINERQWQQHIKEDPKLLDAWLDSLAASGHREPHGGERHPVGSVTAA